MTTSSWRRSALRRALGLAFAFLVITTLRAAGQPAARRWIVDATGAGGAARTIAQAVDSAAPGDTIAVRASAQPYAGGFALKDGQTLAGEGGSPVIAADRDVVRVAGTARDVTISNVTLRAGGDAAGLTIESTKGAVILRDVNVVTAGGVGIAVKGAARLVVGGSSSVAATGAPAVTIDGAVLDAVFTSLSARGAMASGIVLRKTTGRFVVAGKDGQHGSGGTIDGADARAISAVGAANIAFRWMNITRGARANGVPAAECGNIVAGTNERCNAAVYLVDVNGATLEGMLVDGSAQAGVVAHGVRNLAIVSSEVRNAGDEVFEHGLLLQDLSGDCRIVDTKVTRSASRHLMLHNSRGTLTLAIERSTFADNPGPAGQQAVLVSAANDAVVDLRVRDCAFARSFSHALDVTATGQAHLTLNVSGSRFDGNASAINVSATDRAAVQYSINDNPSIVGSSGTAVNVFLGQPSLGTLTGSILRNTIGRSGAAGSGAACGGCSGITLTATGSGLLTAEVEGNVIQQVGGGGVAAVAGQGAPQMRVTIASNFFREPAGSAAAVRVVSGSAATDAAAVCADVGGPGARANTVEGTWHPEGAIHLLHRFAGSRFRVAGLVGGNDAAAAASAVGARNRGAKVRAVLRPESEARGFEAAERCTIQALNR